MRKTPIGMQELRRKIYSKVKTDFGWKRWSREDIYRAWKLGSDINN